MSKKNFDDDDSRWLKRTNSHVKRNTSKAVRKRDKRTLSGITSLSDCFDDEDDNYYLNDKYYDDVADTDWMDDEVL